MKKYMLVFLFIATCSFGLQKPSARAIRIDSDKIVKSRTIKVNLNKVEPGTKKEKWVSTRRQDSPRLGAEQWITYYNGTPYFYWEFNSVGIEGAMKFVKTDFTINYPFWIKKVKCLFYEGTPWTSNQVKFRIYNSTGDTILYESPDVTALKYPNETVKDLGADSLKITAGDFWVSYQSGDSTPTALSDSGVIRNRSFAGNGGNWQILNEYCEFAIQAHVTWEVGTEETRNDMSVEVKYSSNPAKGYGSIFYTIPTKTNVDIRLYDITGKVIAILVDEVKAQGKYEITLGPELVAGVYFCKFKAGEFNKTKKLVLL